MLLVGYDHGYDFNTCIVIFDAKIAETRDNLWRMKYNSRKIRKQSI